jgi:hypothetical protein
MPAWFAAIPALLIVTAALMPAQPAQQPNPEPGWPCTGKPRAIDPAFVQSAEATGGQVFLFDRAEVRGSMLLMNGRTKHPVTIARATGTVNNYVDLRVPVDSSIESLFISVSLQCKQRVILYDPKSQDFRPDQAGGQDDVFLAGRIATIPKPEPGMWTVRLLGTGIYFAVVQAQTPLNLNRVDIQGQTVSAQASSIPGMQFRLVDAADQTIQPLALQATQTPGIFTGQMTPPSKPFRVVAEATDAQGNTVQRLDPHLYQPKP